MVRISEILKKVNKEEIPPKPPQSVLDKKVIKKEEDIEKPTISKVRISPVIMEKGKVLTKVLNKEGSTNLYEEAISLAKEIKRDALTNRLIEYRPIVACVNKFVEQLTLDNKSLLELVTRSTQHYLNSHGVNVCILSLKMGIGLGYDKAELLELGGAAFLHDIGMIEYIDLTNQPRKLTAKEYNEIKNHPITGSEILEKTKELPEAAVHVVLQQHERIDGSGYPYGIKGEAIHEYAKIVGLADSYEAMTHPRPYRDRHMPVETIQELLDEKNTFENKLIKVLIEEVGIFPVGSMVRLNTKEIGMVAGINEGFPTRPVVNIIYGRDNQKLEELKVVDLAKQHTIHIKQCLKEDTAQAPGH